MATVRASEYSQKKSSEVERQGLDLVEDRDNGSNMPQYITQVPWYVEKNSEPTLKHHKFYEPQKLDINNWSTSRACCPVSLTRNLFYVILAHTGLL